LFPDFSGRPSAIRFQSSSAVQHARNNYAGILRRVGVGFNPRAPSSTLETVGNPITKLAADDEQEYLCECFAAYAYYREALKKHDQVGYNLVKKIVCHLNKARS
jgi:hypothetical protein